MMRTAANPTPSVAICQRADRDGGELRHHIAAFFQLEKLPIPLRYRFISSSASQTRSVSCSDLPSPIKFQSP